MSRNDDGRATLRDVFSLARDPALEVEEKLVWLLYRSYETSDGGGFPSDETLAWHVGKSARSVRRYRRRLLERGYLEQELRGPKPARYRAVLPEESDGESAPLPDDEDTDEEADVWPAPSELQKDGSGEYVYPEPFEVIWAAYPRQKGKKTAYRKVRTRINDGAEPAELQRAAATYAARMEREEREVKFMKHASTFFGPDDHWLEELRAGSDDEAPAPPDRRAILDQYDSPDE